MTEKKINLIVSVIIPTYNRANLVGRAIKSVLEQTFKNIELLVIDDGSDDDTEKVVKNFDSEAIKYIQHEENKGAAVARNTGIENARGEYVAFLDSGDEWFPQKLEKQVSVLKKKKDVGIVYVGTIYFDERYNDNLLEIVIPKYKGMVYRKLLEKNIVCGGCSSVLIRKQCFEYVGGFDSEFPAAQDWDMWIRIAKLYKFDYIPNILLKYFSQKIGISQNIYAIIEGKKKFLNKHRKDIKNMPLSCYSYHLFQIGSLLCKVGDIREGRWYLWRSFIVFPNFRSFIKVMLSLLGVFFYKKLMFIINTCNTLFQNR